MVESVDGLSEAGVNWEGCFAQEKEEGYLDQRVQSIGKFLTDSPFLESHKKLSHVNVLTFPSTPEELADAIVENIGVNRQALITDLKTYISSLKSTVEQDWKNYMVGFQPFIDSGALVKGSDGNYFYNPHCILPSVVGWIQNQVEADEKGFALSVTASLKSFLAGVASQVDAIAKFPYDRALFEAKVKALDLAQAQEMVDTFYAKLGMGTPPSLDHILSLSFPMEKPSHFAPKQVTNIGMAFLDPYIHINFSTPITVFPKQSLELHPSIQSPEALPLSTWWQILGDAQTYSQLIQVTAAGTAPSVNPPSLAIDVIQKLYQKTPELFPVFGGNIEMQTPKSAPPFNANALLAKGELSVGDLVGPVVTEMAGNFQPNAEQGVYYIGNTGMGIVFSNPETYNVGVDPNNWQGRTLAFKAGAEALIELRGVSSPIFINGPLEPNGTVTPTGQNSVVYQQLQKDGSAVTIPIVKNSPYMPIFTHQTAPRISIDTLGATLTGVTTFAYDQGQWKEMGSAIQTGKTPMGQLFRFEVKTNNGTEVYSIYTSALQSFTLASSALKKIVPDGTTIDQGNASQYIHYSDAVAAAKAQGVTLPPADELHWFSALIRVPGTSSVCNELIGSVDTGDQVSVVSKMPLETVEKLSHPLSEPFGLPLDQGVSWVPLRGDILETAMQGGQSTHQTTYQFYQMPFPQTTQTTYIGQLLNNFQTLKGAPPESDYASGKLPYYQSVIGVERMVPVTPQKSGEVTLTYTNSNHYGLMNPTQGPILVTDWMDQATSSELTRMVSALTDPHLAPNPTVSDQDYSIAQETETNANTALIAQKLLSLGVSGKLTLTATQETTLKGVVETFTAAAQETLGNFLGSISWDPKHNLLVSIYGNQMPAGISGDFYNSIGQDLQFTNGYFIHAASSVRLLDPTYFATPDASTPFVWDQPADTPNQAQYRARIVDALINEVEPRPTNAHTKDMFPAGRQLDNETHMFKSHGWNQPTLDGQDLESTAEAINFCRASAVWCNLQAQGAQDSGIQKSYAEDRDYHLNHAIEAVRAVQTFRLPENPTSIYQDPLVAKEMQQYGEEITFTNIAFVRKITSDTYWGPGPKDDALSPLGAACMQGINMLAPVLDAATGEKLVKTLFNEAYYDQSGNPRANPDWSQIVNSQLFTNQGWTDPKSRWGIATVIPTTLPYIARYSPNLATGILNWYANSNKQQPTVYPWHLSGNLATTMNYISEAQHYNAQDSKWVDPVSETESAQVTQYLEKMSGANLDLYIAPHTYVH
ncbi:MAG: hypothetical protein KDK64_07505 [Chlamydiia bacterium]|nr:hypothetical protein [Chlamydiia bacterium]